MQEAVVVAVGGGQICHDGYRFRCIICIVGDVRSAVDPYGPEATRQQVILDAKPHS